MPETKIDIQGHRGCRGLMPENTIPAMLKAVELSVTTLELDVVITKDKQVLVSHEPYLSYKICKNAAGEAITEEEEKKYNIYEMTYEEVAQCDCGMTVHPDYPKQQKMAVHKPLLGDMIKAVEQKVKAEKRAAIFYNIETKLAPAYDNIYHPAPEEFADLLLAVLKEKGIADRVTIQSFDYRILRIVKEKAPDFTIALLEENEKTVAENIADLGFKPDTYSPFFMKVDKKMLDDLHTQNIKLIPWTVNEPAAMQQLIKLGVDGIITDYPDLLVELVNGN